MKIKLIIINESYNTSFETKITEMEYSEIMRVLLRTMKPETNDVQRKISEQQKLEE